MYTIECERVSVIFQLPGAPDAYTATDEDMATPPDIRDKRGFKPNGDTTPGNFDPTPKVLAPAEQAQASSLEGSLRAAKSEKTESVGWVYGDGINTTIQATASFKISSDQLTVGLIRSCERRREPAEVRQYTL